MTRINNENIGLPMQLTLSNDFIKIKLNDVHIT